MAHARRPDADPSARLYEDWVGGRLLPSLGTNSGTEPLAFQSWHRFKEAFSPELVHRAFETASGPVKSCLDPFGGSGTTALTAQFLGADSTTVEVNPFLADVIRAKLARYDPNEVADAAVDLRERVRSADAHTPRSWGELPRTFVEPGVNGRWVFGSDVALQIAKLIAAIDDVQTDGIRLLFRVLLGGMLIDVSNVVISGKGRRYRRSWADRRLSPDQVDALLFRRILNAMTDIHQFVSRPVVDATILTADSRHAPFGGLHDLVICSPPYPNSFDYTDVYNVELWMLGYLSKATDNAALRHATLSSHVQLYRDYAALPPGSPLLETVVERLDAARPSLWSPWIPAMVGAYFADLVTVLARARSHLSAHATVWLVVGDSRYAGVNVPTAAILAELSAAHHWAVETLEPFRAMRSSAQQGHRQIAETLIVLRPS